MPFKSEISRKTVDGIPSSSVMIIFFNATTCPNLESNALNTSPYVPLPILSCSRKRNEVIIYYPPKHTPQPNTLN